MATVFIASSTQALATAEQAVGWLAAAGHTPVLWSDPGTFHQQKAIHEELIRISRTVDGAIFIFGADDVVVAGVPVKKTRDNVVFETGLFVGALGGGSVRRILVGRPEPPSDMNGILHHDLDAEAEERVRNEIVDWAGTLLPAFLKALSYERVRDFEDQWSRGGDPVETILVTHAERLIASNDTSEIRAVCSDKGEYGEPYYKYQFDWAAKAKGRAVRRIFLCKRTEANRGASGFTAEERVAIVAHLDHAESGVEIRWLFSDDRLLEGSFANSLGFALFGRSWLLHWGTARGMFHDANAGDDNGLGALLSSRFDVFWKRATPFGALVGKIRAEMQRAQASPDEVGQ